MRTGRIVSVLIILVLLVGTMSAGFFEDIAGSIKQLRFKAAIRAIDNYSGSKDRDFYLLLKGNACMELGWHIRALAAYNKLQRDFPKSKWHAKAAFRMADAHVKLKQFDKACAIYEKALRKLNNVSRRNKLALIYKKIADRLAFPKKKKGMDHQPRPNYVSAISYYDKALEMGKFAPKVEARIHLLKGICVYKRSRYSYYRRQAARIFENILKKFEKSVPAVVAETRFYLASSYRTVYRAWEAKSHFYILARSSKNKKFAVQGAYQLLKMYHFPQPRTKRDFELGSSLVNLMLDKFPKAELSQKALFMHAAAAAYRKKLRKAIDVYKSYLEKFPNSENAAQAAYMRGVYYSQLKQPEKARATFRDFLSRFPASKYWQRVQQRIINIEYDRGYALFLEKKYNQSVAIWAKFLKRYPLYSKNALIMFNTAMAWYHLKKYNKAIDVWLKLAKKYSGTTQSSRAYLMVAETYAEKLYNFEKAFFYYKKVHSWRIRRTASARVSQLKKEYLGVATKRVFHTGERAGVDVVTRNIKQFKVKIYYFDLNTYFRKIHSIKNIEKLDIDLINPDRSFVYNVKKYKKYKKYKFLMPIRHNKPGAYIVSCSTGKHKARSMVVVSNLGLQVKSSPKQIFVFASDLKNKRAFPGVNLLFSNGKEIFMQAKSGRNGIYVYDFKKKNPSGRISVFAYKGGHIAASSPAWKSAFYGERAKHLSHVVTDRPAYRPGDTVRFKTFIRTRKAGRYSIPKQQFTVTFRAASGLTLYQRKHYLTKYGTISGSFMLDSAVSQGHGSLSIVSKDGKITVSHAVRISLFTKKSTIINYTPDKSVYLPGDQINLKIKISHLFGAPAANKSVSYRINRDTWKNIKTDKHGYLTLKINSLKYADSNTIQLTIRPKWDGKNYYYKVPFLKREYDFSIQSVRKKYLTFEDIDTSIELFAPSGISKRRSLKVRLLHFYRGREKEVDSTTITTTSKGKARYSFRGKKPGSYLVVASGRTKSGEIVENFLKVAVVGKEDAQKVYILGKTRKFKEGAGSYITLYSRVKKELALITFERDSVLVSVVRRLDKGLTRIRVPNDKRLFPNFKATVSLLTRDAFYQAAADFTLQRKLSLALKLSPGSRVVRPGRRIELEVLAKNQFGKKVDAELMVAVVDDALYSAIAKRSMNIDKLFYKKYSYSAMKSFSFTPYSYAGKTFKRDKDLVNEEERRLKDSDDEKKRDFSTISRIGKARKEQTNLKQGARRRSRFAFQANRQMLVDQDKFTGLKDGRKAGEPKFADVAFYMAHAKTDRSGRSKLSFKLPDNVTRWRVIVVGAAKDARFGRVDKTFSARKNSVLLVNCPRYLQEGDQVQVSVELLNMTKSSRSGQLRCVVESGGQKSEISKSYNIDRSGSALFTFPLSAATGKDIKLTFSAAGEKVVKQVFVKRKATEYVSGGAGVSSGSVRLFPELKGSGVELSRSMKIRIASPAAAIFHGGPRFFRARDNAALKAGQMLRMVAHYSYLKKLGSSNRGMLARLRGDIMDGLLHFRVIQKAKGSIANSVESQAYAFYAIGVAKKVGIALGGYLYRVARRNLLSAFSKVRDSETKALVLFALSWDSGASYAYLNRLYRVRFSLSSRELAYLATALLNVKRAAMASTVLQMLKSRFRVTDKYAYLPSSQFKRVGWFSGSVENTALAILAFIKSGTQSRLVAKGIAWIMNKRGWRGWLTPLQDGVCTFVTGQYFTLKRIKSDNYRVAVSVNGKKIANIVAGKPRTVQVPQANIRDGRNRVVLNMDGRGSFTYSVLLTRTVKGYQKGQDQEDIIKVENMYPQYRIDGKTFSAGYYIVDGEYKREKNIFKRGAVGTPYYVRAKITRVDKRSRYYVATHYLPAGSKILPKGFSANVRHYELRANNQLVLWLKHNPNHTYLWYYYRLMPGIEGSYQIPPAFFYTLSRPAKRYYAAANSLSYLAQDSDIWKLYKLSPNELYSIGGYYFKQKQYEKAKSFLERCLKKYKIKMRYYKEIARYLLFINIHEKNWKNIVKYFEVLKERYPDLTVKFEDLSVVARAYQKIGEFERAYQILAGITGGYFFQEATISGALQKEKQFKRSAAYMEKLFLEYPDHNEQRTTYYSLAQQLGDLAERNSDKQLKKYGINKKFLYEKSLALFERFLLYYPKSKLAPEAAFSIVSLHIDREEYKVAYAKAVRYAKVYANSAFLDSYHYITAYALFFQKRFSEAIKYCSDVATKKYRNKKGELEKSRNRKYAIHMLGKIFHSLQKFDKALVEYKKVSTKFVDAKRAIRFLKKKDVAIPEVSIFGTKDKAKLRIRYKGVRKVLLTIYKVDFLTLCLKEKNLSRITKVNLAGIKPFYKRQITLSSRIQHLSRVKKLTIPVGGKGAYLVVLKSNSVESSGMIIKSDLVLDVLEISSGGTVRVNVRNKRTGRLVRGVVTKFIGSKDSSFKTAKTDLRGMAEISGLRGLSTIVGVKDGHYCFYRGKMYLSGGRWSRGGYGTSEKSVTKYKKKALESLQRYRRTIQKRNKNLWDNNIQQNQKGINLRKF